MKGKDKRDLGSTYIDVMMAVDKITVAEAAAKMWAVEAQDDFCGEFEPKESKEHATVEVQYGHLTDPEDLTDVPRN